MLRKHQLELSYYLLHNFISINQTSLLNQSLLYNFFDSHVIKPSLIVELLFLKNYQS